MTRWDGRRHGFSIRGVTPGGRSFTRSATARRGYALLELLITLTLLSVFMLLASVVFIQAMALTKEAATLERGAGRIDHAASVLRRDVWGAARIESPAPDRLVLLAPDGTATRWEAGTESTDVETSHWVAREGVRYPVPGAVRWSTDDRTAWMRIGGRRAEFVSQLIIHREAGR